MKHRGPPGPTDRETGIWRGRSVARRFDSPDGMTVLVGKSASDNDVLTFKLGQPRDFWLHVAGQSGSHVLVLNPEGLDRLPRDTGRFAAALAARHSKAKAGRQVAVHVTTCSEVRKPRGMPAGKVTLKKYRSLKASPNDVSGIDAPRTKPLKGYTSSAGYRSRRRASAEND